MEKPTTSETQSHWPAPLFMNPMAMDPVGWSSDLFDITHRNMSHIFDGQFAAWPTFTAQYEKI